jgi:hypothetical protein
MGGKKAFLRYLIRVAFILVIASISQGCIRNAVSKGSPSEETPLEKDPDYASFTRISSQPYYYSSDWDSKPNYIVFLKEKDGPITGMEIRQYEDISYYEWLTFQESENSAAELERRTPSRTIRLYPSDGGNLLDEKGHLEGRISDADRWWTFSIVSIDGEDKWFTGKYGLML